MVTCEACGREFGHRDSMTCPWCDYNNSPSRLPRAKPSIRRTARRHALNAGHTASSTNSPACERYPGTWTPTKTTAVSEPFPTTEEILLDVIRLDGDTQPRVRIDPETVREYIERMQGGDCFPPVQVYFDGICHWPSDGFHRMKAAREVGRTTILAEVWQGTRDDAFWMSLGANKKHGLRRTNEDKVRAVRKALAAKPRLSDAAIAAHVGVSDRMVAKYRTEMAPKDSESAKRTGLDGRTINTANIGKAVRTRSEPPPEAGDMDGQNLRDRPSAVTRPESGVRGEARQVADQLGHPVEGKVAEAFRRRHEIQDLMLAVSKIESVVLKAKEVGDPLFSDIKVRLFQADCDKLYRQLKATLPFAACPCCRAAGCKVCHGRGWIGEFVWNATPKELKAQPPGTGSPQRRASSRHASRPSSRASEAHPQSSKTRHPTQRSDPFRKKT